MPMPGDTDFDSYVVENWPDLPPQQQRSVATWLHGGWSVTGIGHIRPDGVYRPA